MANAQLAAIRTMLAGASPYGIGYPESIPPGAPFAYGPIALLWYLPALGGPGRMETLLTMLVVVASGIAGRYLYAKVHRGLYGKQVVLREILADIGDVKAGLAGEVLGQPGIVAELERFVPAAQYRASVSAAWVGVTPAPNVSIFRSGSMNASRVGVAWALMIRTSLPSDSSARAIPNSLPRASQSGRRWLVSTKRRCGRTAFST